MKSGNQWLPTKLWKFLNLLLFVTVFLVLTGGSIRYFFFWYAAPLPVPNSITDSSLGIKIVGQRDFVIQVKRALWLMKDKHPFSFVTTQKYMGVIQESASTSWMAVDDSPQVCLLSRKDAFHSLTWCVMTISHETYHSKLYNDYRTQNGYPVPLWISVGPAAEHQCLRYQLSVMEFIGAPKSEIDFIRRGDVSYSMRRGDVSTIFMASEGK